MAAKSGFVPPPRGIDRLRGVAGRLLRQSPEYESVVREMGGVPGKSDGDADRSPRQETPPS